MPTAEKLQPRPAKGRLAGSPQGADVAARARKQLNKREAKSPKGRFALRLQSLLDERGWSTEFAATRFGVGEPAVRKWLRAESVPETLDLERIGKALDVPEHPFPDYRLLLPPG